MPPNFGLIGLKVAVLDADELPLGDGTGGGGRSLDNPLDDDVGDNPFVVTMVLAVL